MTTLSVSSASAATAKVDAVVIGVARGPKGLVLAPGADSIATALGKGLLPALVGLGATGKAEEAARLRTGDRVLLMGVGSGLNTAMMELAW